MSMEPDNFFCRILTGLGIYVSPSYTYPDESLNHEEYEFECGGESPSTDNSIDDVLPQQPADENEEVIFFKYDEVGRFLGTKHIEYIPREGHLKHLQNFCMFFQYREEGRFEDRFFTPLSSRSQSHSAGIRSRDGAFGSIKKSNSGVLIRAASGTNTSDILWDFQDPDHLKAAASVTDLRREKRRPLLNRAVSHFEIKDSDIELGKLIRRYGSKPLMSRDPRLTNEEAISFTKYIPVKENRNGIVPYSRFNRHDPRGWCDIQVMLTKMHSRRQEEVSESHPLKVSSSEKQTSQRDQSSFGGSKKPRDTHSASDIHDIEQYEERRLQRCAAPELSTNSLRFQVALNQSYCTIAAKANPKYSAAIFIELKSVANFPLCHVKTELLITAMKHFLYPWSDVQALWVNDLEDQIDRLLQPPIKAKSRFGRIRHSLGSYCAAMLVSPEAGQLLRHKDLGFLHTVAKVLETHPRRLLVMVSKGEDLGSMASLGPK